MAQEVKTEIIYVGNNINQWVVKDYVVSEHRGEWFCSCAIKYKRNPKLKCKHISLVQAFLLSDKQKKVLQERHERRILLEKIKALDLKACKTHLFERLQEKGAIKYKCNKCSSELSLEEFKFYRKFNNLS